MVANRLVLVAETHLFALVCGRGLDGRRKPNRDDVFHARQKCLRRPQRFCFENSQKKKLLFLFLRSSSSSLASVAAFRKFPVLSGTLPVRAPEGHFGCIVPSYGTDLQWMKSPQETNFEFRAATPLLGWKTVNLPAVSKLAANKCAAYVELKWMGKGWRCRR